MDDALGKVIRDQPRDAGGVELSNKLPADGAALLKLHGLFRGNKSRDRFNEAVLKIQPAILAVGQD